ncbi:hypothetical protein RJ639_035178 [Escallonia herrerae]|uniref:Uncharacterized protein n=1 Tax=Escallonia herrerae TaxID=1293975 RepID=A0AA89B7M3_9ASTE|nr:hypothetical protein RJ639_035178 [Escallonia herrerae]
MMRTSIALFHIEDSEQHIRKKKQKQQQQELPNREVGRTGHSSEQYYAWILFNKGRSLELIDAHMGDSCYLSEVLRSIHVAPLCVQQSPEGRPSMSSVVLMLGGEGTLPQPKEPGFFTKRNLFF